MSQNFNELKEKIKEYQIKNIISIDDDWDKSNPMEENLEEYLKEKNYWDDKYEDLFDDIKSLNGNKTITVEDFILDKYPKLEEIKETTSSLFEYSIDTFLLPILKLASKLELNLIKLKSFEELKASGNFENSLVFIDKELLGPGSDEITNIMNLIQKNNNDKLNIFIVYSHTELEELENHETKITYLAKKFKEAEGIEEISGEDYFIIYKNIYLLHGFKKEHDFENFIQNTLDKFKVAVYGKTLQNIFDSKKQVENETYKEIYSRKIEDYDLLFEDSYFEGEAPIEVIKKLVKSTKKDKDFELLETQLPNYKVFSKEIVKKIKNEHHNIDTYKSREREFKSNKLDLVIRDSKIANSIMNRKINAVYGDISKGDIFLINESNFGIIISKECDCIIRKNNNGINRINKTFTLLLLNSIELFPIELIQSMNESKDKLYRELDEKRPAPKKTMKKKDLEASFENTNSTFKDLCDKINLMNKNRDEIIQNFNNYIWPISFCGKSIALFNSKKTIEIDSELIDLCTLNKNGKALLNFESDYSSFKSFFSIEYFKDFNSKFFGKSFGDAEDFLKDNVKPNEKKAIMYSIKNNIEIDKNEDSIIGYKLERIGRLQSQRTLFLLQDYISHFTKPGFNTTPSFN